MQAIYFGKPRPAARKLKHKLQAKVIAVWRATHHEVTAAYTAYVDEIKACHAKVTIAGMQAARILGQAMVAEFEEKEEEMAFHLASAILNDLIEKQAKSTKEIGYMQEPDACSMPTYNVDAVLSGSDAELCFLEQSIGPGSTERQHSLDDSVKLANKTISAKKARLRESLDAPVDEAKKVETFALQLIGNRLTLLSMSMSGKNEFVLTELKSARFPFGWSDVDFFHDVMELLLCCVTRAQETMERHLRKACRHGKGKAGEVCREWL
ncbi:hypothetical protein HDU89_005630 [Geranomyces variabilis]|nr:hypothetical protein HDU89_005630 [Geranomyces variabilis]